MTDAPTQIAVSSARFALNMAKDAVRPNTTELLPLEEYDLIIVSFSGGKDSLGLVLRMLDLGVPKEKIQLWHQSIDGKPAHLGGEDSPQGFLMDWPVTESYCRAVAELLGIRILFSWKNGGFAREMLRDMSLTAPNSYECQDGTVRTSGGVRGKESTRKMFPQVSADLSVRYCSAYLKIDVASAAISNDPALKAGRKILYLSGERREESSARSRYAEMEQHRTHNNKRRVDHWRAVLDYSEEMIWDLIRKYGITPHPAYKLGYSRVSCMECIFMDADQAATNRHMAPERFANLSRFEAMTGKTIKRGKTLGQLADQGTVHREAFDRELVAVAMGGDYPAGAIFTPQVAWTTPPGAYRKTGGPT